MDRKHARRARRGRPGPSVPWGWPESTATCVRLGWLQLLLLGAAMAAGCYDTPKPACGFACGAAQACPSDYTCGADNRCRLNGATDTSDCLLSLPAIDAAPIDAKIDAAVCVNLAPASDGSGRQQLVISEASPKGFLELFNNTDADIALGAGQWGLQSGAVQVFLKTAAASTTVPRHGYVTVAWGADLPATNDSGELALYNEVDVAADFDDKTKLVGYVCWGPSADAGRKTLAEAAGKWTGECAAKLEMSAIRRKVATKGISLEDFLTAVPAEPTNCKP